MTGLLLILIASFFTLYREYYLSIKINTDKPNALETSQYAADLDQLYDDILDDYVITDSINRWGMMVFLDSTYNVSDLIFQEQSLVYY